MGRAKLYIKHTRAVRTARRMPQMAAQIETKNSANLSHDHLLTTESLRASPEQWPESFPGLTEFVKTSAPKIHTASSDYALVLSLGMMSSVNDFARLSPDQLLDKIKTMQDEIYKLGKSEALEMTRGKLLRIFEHDHHTKAKNTPGSSH